MESVAGDNCIHIKHLLFFSFPASAPISAQYPHLKSASKLSVVLHQEPFELWIQPSLFLP